MWLEQGIIFLHSYKLGYYHPSTFNKHMHSYVKVRKSRLSLWWFWFWYKFWQIAAQDTDIMIVWLNIRIIFLSWRRHEMETFSALLALCAGNSPVTGEFPAQRPVTGSFDAFVVLHLNKQLSKQSWGWWFETHSCSSFRHCNEWHVQSIHMKIHFPIFHVKENHYNWYRYVNHLTPILNIGPMGNDHEFVFI